MKVLGEGELTKKLSVTAHSFSKSAVEKIEAAGGTVTRLREPVERKKKKHKASVPAPEESADEPEVVEERRPGGDRASEAADAQAERNGAAKPSSAMFSWLANAWRVPELRTARALHGGDARRLPARVVDSRRRASTHRRSRTTSRAAAGRSSAC